MGEGSKNEIVGRIYVAISMYPDWPSLVTNLLLDAAREIERLERKKDAKHN